MQYHKKSDILLNVILPLMTGLLLYQSGDSLFLPAWIRNYIPDGLWAYSLISSILIIWDREFNRTWIVMGFLSAAAFELLQYYHHIPGTGDGGDILVYAIAFGIALKSNKPLQKVFI